MKDLIFEVKEVYESGEEGAKTFLEFNLNVIIDGSGTVLNQNIYDNYHLNKYLNPRFSVLIISKFFFQNNEN